MENRRRHLAETKLRVVKEAWETENVSIVTKRYDLSSSMVSKWVRQYKQHVEAAFESGNNWTN